MITLEQVAKGLAVNVLNNTHYMPAGNYVLEGVVGKSKETALVKGQAGTHPIYIDFSNLEIAT